MLAKFRVNKWALTHSNDLILIHILQDASVWLKAEKGALIEKDGKTVWRDHRKVMPDWAKEFVPNALAHLAEQKG